MNSKNIFPVNKSLVQERITFDMCHYKEQTENILPKENIIDCNAVDEGIIQTRDCLRRDAKVSTGKYKRKIDDVYHDLLQTGETIEECAKFAKDITAEREMLNKRFRSVSLELEYCEGKCDAEFENILRKSEANANNIRKLLRNLENNEFP